ncbi:MAG: DUF21 domain-containing protein [Bacteroidales bacterium]|nr:DUF21 domain-containing protein [Bacteroidales bacterium]
MEPAFLIILQQSILEPLTSEAIVGMVVVAILLFCSAMISGSEVAYFSLGPIHISELKEHPTRKESLVLNLLDKPERLLANILITNNFINVGIVIIASFVTGTIFNFAHSPLLEFVIKVVIITFLLLLFGEVMPKVYANRFAPQFARRMAVPLVILDKLFQPLIFILVQVHRTGKPEAGKEGTEHLHGRPLRGPGPGHRCGGE